MVRPLPYSKPTQYDIDKWKSYSDGIQSREEIIQKFFSKCLEEIRSHRIENKTEIISCRISQNEKVLLDKLVRMFYMKHV
jgi:hypothetical protein